MRVINAIIVTITLLAWSAIVPVVHAQEPPAATNTPNPAATNPQFAREGVFGCVAGGYAVSVGTMAAVGGVYVPVNDAAVTINTGYLIYKECTLDGVMSRIKESVSSALVRSITRSSIFGTDGREQFVADPMEYDLEISDRTALETLKPNATQALPEPYRQAVVSTAARRYLNDTRKRENVFSCNSFESPETHQEFLGGNILSTGLQGLLNVGVNPACHPLGAFVAFQQESNAQISSAVTMAEQQLDRNYGFKPIEETINLPTATGEDRLQWRTLTPGVLIANTLEQAIGSGFRQTENADEIDEIMGSLFSGLSNQVVSDIRGLRGIVESRQGSPAYLDQLAAESSAGVRQAANNTGMSILNSSLSVETEYNTTKRSVLESLNDAAARLRAAENRCWELIIPAVQQLAQNQDCPEGSTCPPIQLRISTSTQQYIRDGSLQIRATNGGEVLAGDTAFRTASTSVLQSLIATLTASSSASLTAGQTVSARVSPSQPISNQNLSLTLTPDSVFSSGILSLILNTNAQLPIGRLTFTLIPTPPFTAAVLALDVDAARQFADAVINRDITPLITVVEGQIRDSDNALRLLRALVADLQNTNSTSAQRLALERLDTLVSNNLLHTAFDLRTAQEQSRNVDATLDDLVESTIEEWGTGNGWCNVQNPAVVQMWLDRWRVN